jgi:16S rRNA (adenine1518-N6/adenine1519-N6)-dimethyltransferase
VARKRFGQNFLVDDGIIYGIVNAIDPQPDDIVVEIGPGLGALTDRCSNAAEHAGGGAGPRSRGTPAPPLPERLTVHAGDAGVRFRQAAEPGALRIVGNLPYNISSPLLFHLMDFADDVRDQHFMLQKEVVERMVAEPGSKALAACRSCCRCATTWSTCSTCRPRRSIRRPRSIRPWCA